MEFEVVGGGELGDAERRAVQLALEQMFAERAENPMSRTPVWRFSGRPWRAPLPARRERPWLRG